MAAIKAVAPLITIDALAEQFWAKYLCGSYAGADAAAEALLGILHKVYAQGGRDDVRAFLRSFKDQLQRQRRRAATAAAAGPPGDRAECPAFALARALAAAAERLRQFSPVKGHDKLGACVLEELRLRLYRVVTGDTFAADTAVRRQALDCCFVSMMQEEESRQRRQQRLAQQSFGSSASSGSASPTAAAGQQAPPAGQLRGTSLSFSRFKMSEKMAGLAGTDVSSWTSLWGAIMGGLLGHQAAPLMQSLLIDMYAGGLLGHAAGPVRGGGGGFSSRVEKSGPKGAACAAGGPSALPSAACDAPAAAATAAPGQPPEERRGSGGAGDDAVTQSSSDTGGAAAAAAAAAAPAAPQRESAGGGGIAGRVGGAAAFAGRFAAAVKSGARGRMAQVKDRLSRDGSCGGSEGSGPSTPGTTATVVFAPTAAGEGAASAVAGEPGGARWPEPCKAPGHGAGAQDARELAAGGEGGGPGVPNGWVQFGPEPMASPAGRLQLTASSCPPGPAAAAAAPSGGGGDASDGMPPGACHHRRGSSHTLHFWEDESVSWAQEDGGAGKAAALAH